MVAALALLFLAVPFVELYVIVQVAGEIGIGSTLVALVAISVVGAWLCRREGTAVLRRVRDALDRGELPHRALLDGFLILLAGALLVTPGFLTDVLGLLLLLPPTRAVMRRAVLAALRRRVATVRFATGAYAVRDVWGREVHGGPPPPAPHSSLDRP